jgi:hypothetical protein
MHRQALLDDGRFTDHDRDPLKSRKDLLQAQVVQQLLDEHGLGHVANRKSDTLHNSGTP